MRKSHAKIFGLICLLICFLAGCFGGADDVRFARQAMALLVKGVYSVTDKIDWTNFKALEHDMGAEYQRLPNEKERDQYKKAFVEGFRLAFQDKGGTTSLFKNWKLYAGTNADGVSIVSTNTADKNYALLLFIKHEKGRRKLVEIKMVQVFDKELFYNKGQG